MTKIFASVFVCASSEMWSNSRAFRKIRGFRKFGVSFRIYIEQRNLDRRCGSPSFSALMEQSKSPSKSPRKRKRPFTLAKTSPSRKKSVGGILTESAHQNQQISDSVNAIANEKSQLRRSQRIMPEHGKSSSNLSDDLVCDTHGGCLSVEREDFVHLLKYVLQNARKFDGIIEEYYREMWYLGQGKAKICLDEGLWGVDQCRFCWIEDFLKTDVFLPWIVCLKLDGKFNQYRRSLKCLESQGHDAMDLDEWVTAIISKKNR